MLATKISFMNGLANRRFCALPVAPSSQRLEALWSRCAVDLHRMEAIYGPQFRSVGSSPAPHLIFDGRNLYDPERLVELVPARRGWVAPAGWGRGRMGHARRRRLAGKPVEARKPFAAVQAYCAAIGMRRARYGDYRCSKPSEAS
jgi:hypothetical protein